MMYSISMILRDSRSSQSGRTLRPCTLHACSNRIQAGPIHIKARAVILIDGYQVEFEERTICDILLRGKAGCRRASVLGADPYIPYCFKAQSPARRYRHRK